jgi:beta-mannosidase
LRKDGTTTASLISDRMNPIRGVFRLQVMALDGKILRDEHKVVTLPPLSATRVAQYADAALLGDASPAATVAVFGLDVEGEPPSRDVVYFAAARSIAWPSPGLRAELRPDGDGYTLDLHAQHLVRALWIDFGDLDAELSDNALTLLPGESVSLHVKSGAELSRLRDKLRLRSLADVLPSRPG